ncbi:hypothetical protein M0R45_019617 [Rubus argutus]|uniref:non-specific serine/threonine protein kinase n=1 Tax=Rubus argutus TaxID=59490 RepID=A0AAW1X5W4_RUBAR
MSSIAVSYGEKGPVFCGLNLNGSNLVSCYGSNSAITYGTPIHFPFIGLTAGDGFVCGLLMDSNQPYCWGSSGYIQMGVPQPIIKDAQYVEISAGDYHVCGLRKPLTGRLRNMSFVDCWGYNMTKNYVFDGQIQSISAGSEFNCGLFSQNRTVLCWGDETGSRVIRLIPQDIRFRKIAAGQGNVDLAPKESMLSIVGGKFHACGIKSYDHGVICWGFIVKPSTPAPNGAKVYEIAAGNYFTCGILADKSFLPVCWGLGFPTSLPLPVAPRTCRSTPCAPGFYEFSHDSASCKYPNSHICMPCSTACPAEMYQKTECTLKSDRQCDYNCSICSSADCSSNCSLLYSNSKRNERFWSLQLPVIIAEIAFAVILVSVVSLTAVLYVRYKLRDCQCTERDLKSTKNGRSGSPFQKDIGKIRPDLDDLKIRRAQMFTYEELERATSGFEEESVVGKGSFSSVFRDSSSPLAELPAGTLGYLDPEYYRLHYLTTKSDVYSFGVLLLEILSGRKAIDMQYEESGNIVEWAVPLIKAGDIIGILDPVLKPPPDVEALKRIANVACKCVRMRGKERPSMDKVTTALERALALLMGSPCNEQPILPTEVVLGSSRLHKKSSQRSSNRSVETDVIDAEDQRFEFRAPSWITFPSVASSQRRKSSVSDADADGKNSTEARNLGNGDGLRSLEEEIGPASPQEKLFLQHNF